MNKFLRNALSCVLAMLITLAIDPVLGTQTASAGEALDNCGNNLYVGLSTSTNWLGIGPDDPYTPVEDNTMFDFDDMNPPQWLSYASDIYQVVLEYRVYTIGKNAFKGMSEMREVFIPETLSSIGTDAFKGCDKLETVYYSGTEEQWQKKALPMIKKSSGNGVLLSANVVCSDFGSATVRAGGEGTFYYGYKAEAIHNSLQWMADRGWVERKVSGNEQFNLNPYDDSIYDIEIIEDGLSGFQYKMINPSAESCNFKIPIDFPGGPSIFGFGRVYYTDLSFDFGSYLIDEVKPTITGIKDAVYTGNPITFNIKVSVGGEELEPMSDYYAVFSNNTEVGPATVKIFGIGSFGGTITKTFKINPKGTTIKGFKRAKKAFTVKWNKQATQTSGYQIEYSLKSNFSKSKKVLVKKNSTTSKKISKLKSKKKYYVRVRTFKKYEGKMYYSSWSPKKSIKTK